MPILTRDRTNNNVLLFFRLVYQGEQSELSCHYWVISTTTTRTGVTSPCGLEKERLSHILGG